jgi:glycosyltransferase involved in cell wall biosynthesis
MAVDYIILLLSTFLLIYVFSLFLGPIVVFIFIKIKNSVVRIPVNSQFKEVAVAGVNSQQVFKLKTEDFIIEKEPQFNLVGLDYAKHKYHNKIDVLIPAHNEEISLGITIGAIRKACNQNGIECRIIVGLDLCEDKTIEIARKLADLVIGISYRSKWKTLNHLVKFALADWVAFVDVGAIWNSDFVLEFQKHQKNEELLFIAPSYKQIGATLVQRINWALECRLKSIENRVGGPITVHGATVCYRLKYLKRTLDYLAIKEEWFNDDVIIPLTMRALFPSFRGLYLSNVAVIDQPIPKATTGRRSRISFGNLQVLEFIEKDNIELNTVLSILWNRRKFRIFWAYFLSTAILLVGLILPILVQIKLISCLLFFGVCFKSRAFRASLMAPIKMLKLKFNKTANNTNVKWH